jgi:hypothetical protein
MISRTMKTNSADTLSHSAFNLAMNAAIFSVL